jgi:hypothetical protein
MVTGRTDKCCGLHHARGPYRGALCVSTKTPHTSETSVYFLPEYTASHSLVSPPLEHDEACDEDIGFVGGQQVLARSQGSWTCVVATGESQTIRNIAGQPTCCGGGGERKHSASTT